MEDRMVWRMRGAGKGTGDRMLWQKRGAGKGMGFAIGDRVV